MSDNVVVTGGAGLIGSWLTELLVAKGANVTVVDDFSKGKRENLSTVLDSIRLVEGNLENESFAVEALEGADTVYHLASRAYGVGYSSAHHLDMLEHNERITNNLFSAVRKHMPRRLLVTSSSCVYRDDGPDTVSELPVFDGEPELVNWGYGWSKRFLEQKAVIFGRELGIPITVVRPFNIYGERYNWMGENSQAIPMLVKRVLDGDDPVVIWGSGEQRRNYLHAEDCAKLMIKLVELGVSDEPVNIGLQDTISMNDLVRLICQSGGRDPVLKHDMNKPEGRFVKSSDSSRLLELVPGFSPAISIEDGMDRMVGWYRMTFDCARDK